MNEKWLIRLKTASGFAYFGEWSGDTARNQMAILQSKAVGRHEYQHFGRITWYSFNKITA